MRRVLSYQLACVFLTLIAVPALAVIDNTHHDMNTYLSGSFTCYACHGYRQSLAEQATLGTVGSFCYNQCHRGAGGIAGAMPIASDYPNTGNENGALWPGSRVARGNIYNGGNASTLNKYASGHGRTWASMPAIDNMATKPAVTANWPHLGGGDMQCTGCHDVHSNTYAPFLRAPLSVGTGAAAAANTFCVQCHTGSAAAGDGRWVVTTANANGGHPIETDSATASTRTGGTPARHGRAIAIKGTRGAARNDANDNSSVFKGLSLFAIGTGASGLGNPANHYRPGGKLGAMNTPADNGAVMCITCHGVHLPGNVAGTSNLTYVSIGDQAADTEANNPICVACHGPGPASPSGTSNANPGMTAYYHPVNAESTTTGARGTGEVNYTASTGSFSFLVNVGSGAGAADLGANLRLVCTSCHTYGHGGASGTMLLTTKARTCDGCHDTTTPYLGSAVNSHHRYGGQRDYTSSTYGSYSNPSYAATNPTVNLANGLSCDDCHVFNGTAHNW